MAKKSVRDMTKQELMLAIATKVGRIPKSRLGALERSAFARSLKYKTKSQLLSLYRSIR